MTHPSYDPKKILVVDNDVDLLMLLERTLNNEGYWVETAATLEEAGRLLHQFNPDLILLDVNINGQDGRYFCGKIKMGGLGSKVKVVLMSAYEYNTIRSSLFGADDFLAKPFSSEFILFKVQQHLLHLNTQLTASEQV